MANINWSNQSMVREMEKKMKDIFFSDIKPETKDAFLKVQRHLFIKNLYSYDDTTDSWSSREINMTNPDEESLKHAYTDTPLVISVKDNKVLSTSSQPSLMAYMIDLADLRNDSHVLEIGTGSGYNASVIAEIVSDKNVDTVEIERDVAAMAQENIQRAGKNIQVVVADGTNGVNDPAPYDSIIVTCATPDIPWTDSLKEGGKVVIPLLTRGLEVLCLFTKKNGILQGKAVLPVRFLTFTGVNTILSDYKKNVKSLERLLIKAETDDELTKKIAKLSRRERFSFLFFLSVKENNSIYYLSENKDLESGYGIWKKDAPFGISMIFESRTAYWGDKSVIENLRSLFEEWNTSKVLFNEYSIHAYPVKKDYSAPENSIFVGKKYNNFLFIPEKN